MGTDHTVVAGSSSSQTLHAPFPKILTPPPFFFNICSLLVIGLVLVYNYNVFMIVYDADVESLSERLGLFPSAVCFYFYFYILPRRSSQHCASTSGVRCDLVSAKLPTLCLCIRTLRTCPPLTSLLIAAEAPQPLVCAIRACIRAWSRPAGRQASRTPPARASYRPEALILPRTMPARRRKPQTMALFDAVQRRAGLLDFKQPLQPPRRGYPACMIGARRYLALR